jgi:trk system potassium uptake protein TrkH
MFGIVQGARGSLGHAMARYVGLSAIFVGAIELMPLVMIPFDLDDQMLAPCFIFPGLCTMAFGYLIYFAHGKGRIGRPLDKRSSSARILMVWLLAIAVYAVPFVAAGMLDPFQALFESTSGLTTTGLSIIDVDSCPRIFLLHRSLMHYFGGVGLVLVLTVILNQGKSLQAYNLEGHTDRLLPGAVGTARIILILYASVITVGALAYHLCGMSWFDSVNYSISAVSTGGFTTHATSVAYFDSISIQVVSIVLMLIGATNFYLNFLLIKGKFRNVLTHVETRFFYLLIATSTTVVALAIASADGSAEPAGTILTALFQVVSVITTTGFQTVPAFTVFPPSALFVFMVLMFTGSEAGSTAGGIKLYRIIVTTASIIRSLKSIHGHAISTRAVKINKFGRKTVLSREEMDGALSFVIVYTGVFVVGSFVFSLCGASIGDAVFDFASCLGNVGIGIGFINSASSPVVLMAGALGMILGRLEIIPVFVGIDWLVTTKGRGGRP